MGLEPSSNNDSTPASDPGWQNKLGLGLPNPNKMLLAWVRGFLMSTDASRASSTLSNDEIEQWINTREPRKGAQVSSSHGKTKPQGKLS